MKYRNIKTGFVFDSPCEIKAEGWEKLIPSVSVSKEKETKKPAKIKKVKEDE